MKLFLFLTMILLEAPIWALNVGGDVGNGGDAVACSPSNINAFKGYYSLDYLVQYRPELQAVAAKDLDASLQRIETQLNAKLPELVASFQTFRRNLFNENDASQIHFWEKSSFGLVDIKDENLVSMVPENCRHGDQMSIVQAVIRVNPQVSGRPPGKFLFRYVPEVVDELNKTNPVQLSFLVVHEWLWDLSNNVDRNRRINYWLHSANLENWSREEWLKNLSGIGFVTPDMPNAVYDPSICLPDPAETARLFTVAEGRFQNPHTLILGYGKPFMRSQTCDRAKNTCNTVFREGPPRLAGRNPIYDFLPYLKVEIFRNQLLVRSQVDGGKQAQHFTCDLDQNSKTVATCTPLIQAAGDTFEPKLQFQVTVGKNCMRFTGKNEVSSNYPGEENSFAIVEYVLNFPKITF